MWAENNPPSLKQTGVGKGVLREDPAGVSCRNWKALHLNREVNMKKETDPYQEYLKIKDETLALQEGVERKIQEIVPRFCLDTIPPDDPRTMDKIVNSALHPIMSPGYGYTNREFKRFLKR